MYYEIKTERLLLRPLSIADLETAHEYSSDEENTRFMMFLPNRTLAETSTFLTHVTMEWAKSQPTYFEFAIVLNGLHIGAISVYLDEKREEGELGWILNRQFQQRGYALEAARAVKDFALNVLHLKKIFAQCDYRNTPSSCLMGKIGMKLESDNGVRTYVKRNETARELTYSLTVE